MTNTSGFSPLNQSHENSLTGRRPTWATIDLNALAENFQIIKRRVGQHVQVMAVVKANAYGHGAQACARRLETAGADWFGVALPEEGIELRGAGISKPILCLGGFWEGQADSCIQNKLVPVVYRLDMIEAFDRAAKQARTVADVHVKIDTGMGRLGFRWDEVNEFIDNIRKFENVRVDGLMTHFAAADDPTCGPLTEDQIHRFTDALSTFREHGFDPRYRHVANSAGIYGDQTGWQNMVRPGGVLYGLWRDILPPNADEHQLRPVMSLKSRIMLLKWVPQGETLGYGCTFEASRRTLVATIPVGYDDGYMRGLSNRAHVIVKGTLAPIAGRISMDLSLVDVTNVPGVSVNDDVTLFGVVGDQVIPVEELAKIVGTISYEVTCRVGKRVPRIFI